MIQGDAPGLEAGGLFIIEAGKKGVMFDERNSTLCSSLHAFHLWVDPGEDMLKSELDLAKSLASSHTLPPADLPVVYFDSDGAPVTGGGGGGAAGLPDFAAVVDSSSWCRVLIGEQFGAVSPAPCPLEGCGGGMLLLHLRLNKKRGEAEEQGASSTTGQEEAGGSPARPDADAACGGGMTLTIPGGYRAMLYVISGDDAVNPVSRHLCCLPSTNTSRCLDAH